MELQEINVFIDKDGQVKLEVQGVEGMTCVDLTKELEDLLGGEVLQRELTHESQATVQAQAQEQWQWG
ncbi:MAG: DUF2997 domain-containing protein [Synechocystis sp.]|jgi:hypothetical protein